jgi:hypothetical protein
MWRVYWLCWMETWHMWISILWTLSSLFNWHPLYHYAVQTEDTLKIIPIGTVALGYTMDIPADGYTAKWTAQPNAATTSRQWPWHLWYECFVSEQYSVFTYTLIQTQRCCIHTLGLEKLHKNCMFWKFVCKYLIHFHSFYLFNFLPIFIPHVFDTLLWNTQKLHCLNIVRVNVLYILCIGHLPDVVPDMSNHCRASTDL